MIGQLSEEVQSALGFYSKQYLFELACAWHHTGRYRWIKDRIVFPFDVQESARRQRYEVAMFRFLSLMKRS